MTRRGTSRWLTIFLAGTVFATAFIGTAFAANELLPRATYPTGDRPLSVARTDVDLDGDADLLVAEGFAGTVAVMQNNGAAEFTRKYSYKIGSLPVWVAAGRLDGDGFPDMAAADERSGRVYVRLNNRSGGFGSGTYYTVGRPSSVAIRDVTGDGRSDLLVTSQSTDELVVFRGNGKGGFSGRSDYRVQNAPRSIAFGDFNKDGRTDVVVANVLGNTISVLVRTSTGFATAKDLTTNTEPFWVDVADVDGDGIADIATTHKQTDSVWTFLSNGSGTFRLAPYLSVGHDPSSGALVNLNDDGRMDLVSASYLDDVVSTYLGDGSGNFVASTSYPGGNGPWSAAVGDLDGDQRADVVTADCEGDTLSVFRSNTGAAASSMGMSGASIINYGKTASLSAKLSSGGSPAPGRSVVFEKKISTGWARIATKTTSVDGIALVSVKPTAKTTYRARYAGSSSLRAAVAARTVSVRAYLSTPTGPSVAGRGRAFSVTGYLKPRHPSGARSVKLYCYRYEAGRWVLRRTVMAVNKNYGSYTRFVVSLSLPSSGKWRIRAYHADTGHSAKYGGYRYVTVR